jgi:hypothetical protein
MAKSSFAGMSFQFMRGKATISGIIANTISAMPPPSK